jgi:Spy/CpxP family protein refolding chaperone
MRKFNAVCTLALVIVVSTMPALADDNAKSVKTAAPTAAPTPAAAQDQGGDGAPAGRGKRKHEGGGHHGKGRMPGKLQVMALSDLTDKQKSQLQTIYDSKKAEFADLRKQMHALEADQWQQVQGVLTPAQIESLGGKRAAAADGGGDGAGKKDAAADSTSAK